MNKSNFVLLAAMFVGLGNIIGSEAISLLSSDENSSAMSFAEISTQALTIAGQMAMGDEMVLIPAGEFVMGNATNVFPAAEGHTDELPQHTVYVSAFYMGKYEVTKALWDEVYVWATSHGYSFDNAGTGKATSHPVQTISWYDCVKWCNAKSEKEGLAPAYYTSPIQNTPYRTGQTNIGSDCVNWIANGYRLPTEAEWEKAAHGGIADTRFPWTDFTNRISHAKANFRHTGGESYAFDTTGFNPACTNGGKPYTSQGGTFGANNFNLYDMAGNVLEWCWDWYDGNYYSATTGTDPRGPMSGSYRLLRGGGWGDAANRCRVAWRYTPSTDLFPTSTYVSVGFRLARSVPPDEMVLIPAGEFVMGNATNVFPASEGSTDELPQHTVNLSAYYIGKYEVTKALWDDVYVWAINNGYAFDNLGDGKTANHPVYNISWHDSVKWCNARSEKEGLVPCYYAAAGQITPYRTGQTNIGTDCVNWLADGYRLPTEAEYEKASRGGVAGARFPWTDFTNRISHAKANFNNYGTEGYLFGTTGYHPAYSNGVMPHTSPVGSFPPNGYGLYDMAGNVWNWCWDWYSSSSYESSATNDPRGPSNGTQRIIRGGCYLYDGYWCRTAQRYGYTPVGIGHNGGLRLVRSKTVGISPSNSFFTATGGSGTTIIYASPDEDWHAHANDGWIQLAGTTNGTGEGQIFYIVSPNTNMLGRTGFITINSVKHNIWQSGYFDETLLGGSGADLIYTATRDSLGNIYIAGTTTSSNFPVTSGAHQTALNVTGKSDAFIAKYTSNLTISACTLLGGSDLDEAHALYVDAAGNVYVAGDTQSTNFPIMPGAYRCCKNGTLRDMFVAKLTGDLTTLQKCTYLGGVGYDAVFAMAGMNNGIIIAGQTMSADFPTSAGAYDISYNGAGDAVVAILDVNLSNLVAATYIGGTSNDLAYALDVDASGQIYLGGQTASATFPVTPNAYDPTPGMPWDGFISSLDAGLTMLRASTLLGYESQDLVYGLKVASNGTVWVAGETFSPFFPTTAGAYDTTHNGLYDAYIHGYSSNLTDLVAGTFYGGGDYDGAYSLGLDGADVLIAGDTYSQNLANGGRAITNSAGYCDSFVARFSTGLGILDYATYLGGGSNEFVYAVTPASGGNVYIAGDTYSTNFPYDRDTFLSGAGIPNIYMSKFVARYKTTQTITFDAPGDQFVTNCIGLYATASSGLPAAFTVQSGPATLADETNLTFSGTGMVTLVVSQAGDENWHAAPNVTNRFAVAKAQAQVTLDGLSQVYDGTARTVIATTDPESLYVAITYNGSGVAPVNAGSYTVVGVINDTTYQGATTGLLIVARADQSINFPAIGGQFTTNRIGLSATASSGLAVSFAVLSGPASLSGGTNLTFSGAGQVAVRATQAGAGNWNAAAAKTNAITVTKAIAGVVLNGLSQSYNGTARTVTATTVPTGLPVDITYDGSATAPVNVGGYSVTGVVNHTMYQGGATGALTVQKGAQSILFPLIGAQTVTNKLGLASTASSGLAVNFAVLSGPASLADGTNLTFSGAGMVLVKASQGGDANWDAAPDVTNQFNVAKAWAGLTLSGLSQTYDGTARTVTATTVPAGLSVAITYDGSGTAPVNAGSYTVVSIIADATYQGGITGALVVAKAGQLVNFPAIGNQLTTNKVGLAATAASGMGVTFDVGTGPATITGGTNLAFNGAGSVSILATQSGDTNWNAAVVTNTFNVSKVTAGVALNNLAQTYNGSAKIVTAITVPAGLTVNITYDGSGTAPVNAGSYTVVGIVNETMYQGGATDTLVVAKAAQSIIFPALDDQMVTNKVGLRATASSGLAVSFAVGSGPGIITGGTNLSFNGDGVVSIVAVQAGDGNWSVAASKTNSLTVTKAQAGVSLSGLNQAVDGTPRRVTAATDPAGLAVVITYNGVTNVPVHAGSYAVTGTVVDALYCGVGSGILTVVAGDQVINFQAIPTQRITNRVVLTASANSGLPVGFMLVSGPAVLSASTNLTFTGTGVVAVAALQVGNADWNPASAMQSFDVTKVNAFVFLWGLNQTYNGQPRPVTVVTTPTGLPLRVTYNGATNAPVSAGGYAINAAVDDAIYQGSATGALIVAKADQAVNFPAIGDQFITNKVGLAAAASSGMPVGFSVGSGPAVITDGTNLSFASVGAVSILATQAGDTNWNLAAVTNSLNVSKALAGVTLVGLNQPYDGTARAVSATTTPAGLTVNITYDGSGTAPVNAGSYAVVGTVASPIYQGGSTGTLVVAQASQAITFPAIPAQTTTSTVTLAATASSGLPVSFLVAGGPGMLTGGTNLAFTEVGWVVVVAGQTGNVNYTAAPRVTNLVEVLPTVPALGLPICTNVSAEAAILEGSITTTNGATVTERGFYWSTNALFPAAADKTRIMETGLFGAGPYALTATGMPYLTTIYLHAYAVNVQGTGYSARIEFLTPHGPLPVAAWYLLLDEAP